jgi:hypothetical protein
MCSLQWGAGKLMTGGKDGKCAMYDCETEKHLYTVDMGRGVIRAVDFQPGRAILGFIDGTILECGPNGKD